MQDPIMTLIRVKWPILKNHLEVIMSYNLVQQWNMIQWHGWFGLKSEGTGTNTDSRSWFKSSLGSKAGFGSRVGSKSKNWVSHSFPINGMWLSKIIDSCSRFIGTGNVSSTMWSKSGKDIGV